jgi:hypothetical protein
MQVRAVVVSAQVLLQGVVHAIRRHRVCTAAAGGGITPHSSTLPLPQTWTRCVCFWFPHTGGYPRLACVTPDGCPRQGITTTVWVFTPPNRRRVVLQL